MEFDVGGGGGGPCGNTYAERLGIIPRYASDNCSLFVDYF